MIAHRLQIAIEQLKVPSGWSSSRSPGIIRRFAGIIVPLCLATISFGQAERLPSSWQQKTVANSFSKQRTIPRVDHGYLFSYQPSIVGADESNLFVRSLATGQEHPIKFWISGASEIRVEDVSISLNGMIFVAGALTRSGDIGATSFVAVLDGTGDTTKFIDLGRYRPKRVCAANDGTFWTFGQVMNGDNEFYRGQLLREYSADGHMLNAFLPIAKFPGLARVDYGRTKARLTCGDESVGLYLSRPMRWIEVQFNDKTPYKWRLQAVPPGRMTGLALMETHQVYATFANRVPNGDGTSRLVSSTYRLNFPVGGQTPPPETSLDLDEGDSLSRLNSGNRDRGSWAPIGDTPNGVSGKLFLLGRDDQSLVYAGPKDAGANPTFYWVRPLAK